jgi:hypothetical protein
MMILSYSLSNFMYKPRKYQAVTTLVVYSKDSEEGKKKQSYLYHKAVVGNKQS